MYLIRGINNIELFRDKFSVISTIATIGNFDGLHLGHQQILKAMQKEAELNDLKKLVIFTEPHAQEFFAEASGVEAAKPPRIFPWQEKVRKMNELKVDFSFFLKFNSQLKKNDKEKNVVFIRPVTIFADPLIKRLPIDKKIKVKEKSKLKTRPKITLRKKIPLKKFIVK